jgi:uncharacterized membrane protein YsdA (DUF1294 family)
MSDETIRCAECGQPFIWSSGEQRYFRERGLSRPKHCRTCRSRRRRDQGSGKKGFSGPPSGSAAKSRQRQSGTAATTLRSSKDSSRARSPRKTSRSWWANPTVRFGVIAFGLTLTLTLALIYFTTIDLVMAWLLTITSITFWFFGYDKAIAGSRAVRVPENVLFALVFLGGTFGALLARPFFHHKTIKFSFNFIFWTIVFIQILLIVVYFLWVKPGLGL